jgi:hypothetical protein
MKQIITSIMAVVAVLSLSLAPLAVETASAATNPKAELCKGSGGTWNGSTCSNANSGGVTVQGTFKNIVDVLLFIIGAVAVIMIIIGGIRYTLSGGDSSAVNSAKNTILYAVIGLIVAFVSYGIVRFIDRAF